MNETTVDRNDRAVQGRITVCVPMFNEIESVERIAGTVFASTLWQQAVEKELLICINGSNDGTERKALELAAAHSQVKVFIIEKKGKNLAWNELVRRSSPESPYLFFLDADIVLEPGALEELFELLRVTPGIDVVGASLYPLPEQSTHYNVYQRMVARQTRLPLVREARGDNAFIRGGCYAIRRSAAERVRMPADQRIADDQFLNHLFAGRSRICRSARVFHKPAHYADQIRQRSRNIASARLLRLQYPGLARRNCGGRSFWAKLGYFLRLSLEGKAMVFLNQCAELLARVRCRMMLWRGGDTWGKICSTKVFSAPPVSA